MSLQPQLQALRDVLEEPCPVEFMTDGSHQDEAGRVCPKCNGSGKRVRPEWQALYRVVVEGERPCGIHISGPKFACDLCFPIRYVWDAPDMEWALWGTLCGATMSLAPVLVGLNRKLVNLPYASWVSIAAAALEAVTAALGRVRDH